MLAAMQYRRGMTERFGRTIIAVLFALVGAAVVGAVTLDLEATIASGLAGVIAALVATGTVSPPPRQRAERERRLHEPPPAEPDLASILEAVEEPLLLVTDLRVVQANAAARTLLGDHIVGQDVRLAIRHPAAAERLTGGPGATGSGATQLVGLGQRDQRWELRATRLPSGHQLIHLINLTGSYAAERMRVDFVANASHELRTPLAAILGFCETLREEAGEEPETRDRFLGVMQEEARRMQRLINDLISLSRIEAEKYRLPSSSVALGQLAQEVRSELRATGSPRADEIALETEDDLPLVNGDRAQLSQLLHNVIGNALKYGRAGTPVAVKLRRQRGDMVLLSVADEGDGISPEHLPRLTERFYRVDSGRSRSLGGTGLGLAIVKHIVERHRGRLEIRSILGQGTTVTVLLPPAVAPGASGGAPAPTGATGAEPPPFVIKA